MFHPAGGRVKVRALVLTNHEAMAPGTHWNRGERVLVAGSFEPQPAYPITSFSPFTPPPEPVRTTCSPLFSRRRLASLSHVFPGAEPLQKCADFPDRKSTRLNSSHVATSYAVFCLKK